MQFKNIQYKIKWPFRLLAFLVIFIFSKLYRIKAKVPKEVKQLNGSYLLLSNHVGGEVDMFCYTDRLELCIYRNCKKFYFSKMQALNPQL